MQIFGEDTKKSPESTALVVGDQAIEVKKVASLAMGTHKVRFYPLSPEFYQGADYPVLVQLVHWVGGKPVICRRTSYDYTGPDTESKPHIDSSCVICTDKFNLYKKAKAYKDTDKAEYDRLRELAKGLFEKTLAASIVSVVDPQGNLGVPIVLRFGVELLNEIQRHAMRVLESTGVNICDPVKGYLFDISVTKNDGGYRSYKNSCPPVTMTPVDISNAPWKWQEICAIIKSEIKPIPSPEEVREFYLSNYGNEGQEFQHPAFNSQVNNNAVQNAPAVVNSALGVTTFTPGGEPPAGIGFKAPIQQAKVTFTPGSGVPSAVEQAAPAAVQQPVVPAANETPHPCHANSPGGSGYDPQDANCKGCNQVASCNVNSAPFVQPTTVVKPGGAVVSSAQVNSQVPTASVGGTVVEDVQQRLNVLRNKIGDSGA